jgi:hypothetical protein
VSTHTSITLPDAIGHYFAAANRFDAAAAAACFTPDAIVHDEAQDHIGTDAINSWIAHASEKYQPHATVISARDKGDKLVLAVRVAGQFPGSPANLEFEFLLRDEKIAELTIQ